MRWKPIRAGILNVWEYDDQTFDFGDGRLALRGRNGSGKSNALALLCPFIFDAVMSAARMDPMGGGRSMKSLLLGRDDDDRAGRYRHDSGTGYVWMEFGNGENSLTIGIGAAATQHRDADSWFFVTSQRVGHDLELTDNDRPLNRRQLEARITGGTVFQKADEYRAAVDRLLFGLGESRYRRLVDLLLTLRRPHLAGKLDTENLSATLSAGLGELDAALINDVAHSFDDLESMQKELDGLATSLTAVERFLPVYREHLLHAGRDRGQNFLNDVHAIRDNDRELSRARRELSSEEEANKLLVRDKGHAEAERTRLAQQIENILVSPAYQDATTLDEVRKAADSARVIANTAIATTRLSTAQADDSAARSVKASAEAKAQLRELDTAIAGWFAVARVAGLDLSSRSEFDETWAISLIVQRRHELDQVKRLVRQMNEASTKARQADELAISALAKVSEAQQGVDTSRTELAAQQSALAERRAEWTAGLRVLTGRFAEFVPNDPHEPHIELMTLWGTGATTGSLGAADDVEGTAIERSAIERSAIERGANADIESFHTTDRRVGDLAFAVKSAFETAEGAEKAQQGRIAELEAERSEVEHEPNPGPPINPTRPDASDVNRPGVPLYVCVDFVEHVHPNDRSGLEAALGAAGILDARLMPDDDTIDWLDATIVPTWRHDDVAASGVGGSTLADVLVPVPVDGLNTERIVSVLRSIPLAGDLVALGTDGSWRLGPLAGRFAQAEPQFIGHAARERRRAERLAAFDEQLRNERTALAAMEQNRRQLATIQRSLRDLRNEQPKTSLLSEALAHFLDWTRRLDDRQVAAESAKANAEVTLKAAESVSLELQRTASRLRLPSDEDAVQGVERVLGACESTSSDVRLIQRTADFATRSAEEASRTTNTMRQRAEADMAAASSAEGLAIAEQSRYEQLRTNVGGDAERAVEELASVRTQRAFHDTAASEIGGRLVQSDGNVVRLTERIAFFERSRGLLEANLATAQRRFDLICGTEISEVIGIDGVDPTADRQAAARLLVAAGDNTDDAVNRMERAYREILLDGLRAGHDPSMPKVDGIDIVRVGTADGDLPIGALARQLREEHQRTNQLLTSQEREIFETHLLTRVGEAIRQLLLDADAFEHRINEEMARVPTESKMIVELSWEPEGDEPALRSAIQALRTSPELLGPDRRDSLREFFMRRIADVRSSDPGRSFAKTLNAVLDYRAWHQFVLYARFSSGKRQRVTRTFYRGLSGGEAATLLHLPLFAAAAAQYTNGSVAGPRIVALDEAFVGIDDKMRARLMGLLTQLDLDVILTSHEFWGFYDTVPALVLYDLVRRPPMPGVYAQRFDWVADSPVAVK